MYYCYNVCESIIISKLKIKFIISYILVGNKTPGGGGGKERREGCFLEVFQTLCVSPSTFFIP